MNGDYTGKWNDFRKEPTPSFARQVKDATTIGRTAMQQAAFTAASDPASSANRAAAKAEARRKSSGIVEKMKQGFGHPACNPIARFIPKAS